MLVDSLRSTVQNKRQALTDRLHFPTPAELIQRENQFVLERDALFQTRTVISDIRNALNELPEVQDELGPYPQKPTKGQMAAAAKEVVDFTVYTMSAIAANGINPDQVHRKLSENHVQRRARGLTPILADRFNLEHPQFLIDNMRHAGENALAIIQTKAPLDFHEEMVETALIHMLDTAFVTGRAMHPLFDALVADKIRANHKRFPIRRFAMQPGDDPEAVKAIGYAASKIAEGKWTEARAHATLKSNPAVIKQHGEDTLLALLAATI